MGLFDLPHVLYMVISALLTAGGLVAAAYLCKTQRQKDFLLRFFCNHHRYHPLQQPLGGLFHHGYGRTGKQSSLARLPLQYRYVAFAHRRLHKKSGRHSFQDDC